MIEQISFAGNQRLDLNQTIPNIKDSLQAAIDKFFPSPNNFAKVNNCYENGKILSFDIFRNYVGNAGCSFGPDFICDKDASLITGLDESAFQPFEPDNALIFPSFTWNDHMCYVLLSEFYKLWKHQIKTMAGSEVKKITVKPSINSISIKIEF